MHPDGARPVPRTREVSWEDRPASGTPFMTCALGAGEGLSGINKTSEKGPSAET